MPIVLFDSYLELLFANLDEKHRRKVLGYSLLPENSLYFDNGLHGKIRVGLRRWGFST